jgi:thiol-disulfide isomerase/thioredoxin
VKARAIFATLAAIAAGLVVLVFVRFRGLPGEAGGGGVAVGVDRAEATCTDGATACLPKIPFVEATGGGVVTPESLAGKVVVVNFWATWCQPCLGELPDLVAAFRRYRDRGVVLLGVLADDPAAGSLAAFAADHGIDYPIVRGDAAVSHAFGDPDALPTTFGYDRHGRARYARPGAISGRQLTRLLDELVGE